jgi:hypothetical protein
MSITSFSVSAKRHLPARFRVCARSLFFIVTSHTPPTTERNNGTLCRPYHSHFLRTYILQCAWKCAPRDTLSPTRKQLTDATSYSQIRNSGNMECTQLLNATDNRVTFNGVNKLRFVVCACSMRSASKKMPGSAKSLVCGAVLLVYALVRAFNLRSGQSVRCTSVMWRWYGTMTVVT